MNEQICFVIWPPALKHYRSIIKKVKEEFNFISFNVFEFNDDWLTLIDCTYGDVVGVVMTKKRHIKAKKLQKYNKEIGVIRFDVYKPKYHIERSTKKKVISSVHILKNYLRKKVLVDIDHYYTLHSTDSTIETKRILEYLRNKAVLRNNKGIDINEIQTTNQDS